MADDDDIPRHFCCPISWDIMDDPVIAEDGHTYERKTVVEAMKLRRLSPMTNAPIGGMLIPNHSLRTQIGDFAETIVKQIRAECDSSDSNFNPSRLDRALRTGEACARGVAPSRMQFSLQQILSLRAGLPNEFHGRVFTDILQTMTNEFHGRVFADIMQTIPTDPVWVFECDQQHVRFGLAAHLQEEIAKGHRDGGGQQHFHFGQAAHLKGEMFKLMLARLQYADGLKTSREGPCLPLIDILVDGEKLSKRMLCVDGELTVKPFSIMPQRDTPLPYKIQFTNMSSKTAMVCDVKVDGTEIRGFTMGPTDVCVLDGDAGLTHVRPFTFARHAPKEDASGAVCGKALGKIEVAVFVYDPCKATHFSEEEKKEKEKAERAESSQKSTPYGASKDVGKTFRGFTSYGARTRRPPRGRVKYIWGTGAYVGTARLDYDCMASLILRGVTPEALGERHSGREDPYEDRSNNAAMLRAQRRSLSDLVRNETWSCDLTTGDDANGISWLVKRHPPNAPVVLAE